MLTIEQRLFETYGASILDGLDSFPGREVMDFLSTLPIDRDRRIDLYDRASRFYDQWSADAFAAGLHLGLSLRSGDIRRRCPEQV